MGTQGAQPFGPWGGLPINKGSAAGTTGLCRPDSAGAVVFASILIWLRHQETRPDALLIG